VLHDKLKVSTLDDLRRLVRTARLHQVRGFGPIIEKKLSAALEKRPTEKRFELSVAEAEAEALVGFLRNGGRVVVAGSYRRRRDTVGDLDVVVTTVDGATVGDKLVGYENAAQVLAHAPTRATVVLRSGLQVDVRAVPEQSSAFIAAGSSTNMACFPAGGALPALPRRKSIKNLDWRASLRSCARTAARLRLPPRTSCRGW
jgi:DNA polymerase (family 10)